MLSLNSITMWYNYCDTIQPPRSNGSCSFRNWCILLASSVSRVTRDSPASVRFCKLYHWLGDFGTHGPREDEQISLTLVKFPSTSQPSVCSITWSSDILPHPFHLFYSLHDDPTSNCCAAMDYFVQVVKHSADTENLTQNSYCAHMQRSRATFHGGTKDVNSDIPIFQI